MQRSGSDKPIIEADKPNDLSLVKTVAFHRERIDNNLHQLFTRANEVDLKNTTQAFNFFFEIFRSLRKAALRNIAREIQNKHRVKTRHLHFIDGRFIRFAW